MKAQQADTVVTAVSADELMPILSAVVIAAYQAEQLPLRHFRAQLEYIELLLPAAVKMGQTGYCLALFASVVADLTADGATRDAQARLLQGSTHAASKLQQPQPTTIGGSKSSAADLYDLLEHSSSSSRDAAVDSKRSESAAAAALKLFSAVLRPSTPALSREDQALAEPLLAIATGASG